MRVFLFDSLAHTQVKYSTQLYSKLLLRALSHDDFRMRLAAIIAIGETAIDNLSFQIKVIPPSLFHRNILTFSS